MAAAAAAVAAVAVAAAATHSFAYLCVGEQCSCTNSDGGGGGGSYACVCVALRQKPTLRSLRTAVALRTRRILCVYDALGCVCSYPVVLNGERWCTDRCNALSGIYYLVSMSSGGRSK